MSLFKKDTRSPMQKELDKIFAGMQKSQDERVARQMKINACEVQLKSCDRVFKEAIEDECYTGRELEENGFEADAQRARIRQAAMGRIVVKRSLIELQSVATEQQLNKAINNLGVAIRQMHRVSNFSTQGVSRRNRKAIAGMLPSEEDAAVFELIEDENFPIPPEIADKVNESFVNNLMDGMSFDECLKFKGAPLGAAAQKTGSDRERYAEIINRAASKQ